MKYIIFEDFAGEETPIIFPKRIRHEELRRVIPYVEVVSAGRIRMTGKGIECYGGAKTLNVQSRTEDNQIIKDFLEEK